MNIICFSNIDWDFLKQRHQHIMSEFAKKDSINNIIFVETIGSRSVKFHKEDISRVIRKLRNLIKKNKENLNEAREPKIIILSPKCIPIFNKLIFRLNTMLLKFQIDSVIKKYNIDINDTIAWTILQHPSIEMLLRKYNFNKKIFDCIDDVKSIPDVEKVIVETEENLIKESDLVFATSKKLLNYCRSINKNSYILKNAVNKEFIDCSNKINKNDKKIVGYVGTIYNWFDIDKVIELAKRRDDIEIVLAGPIRIDIDILKNFDNVKILGKVSHSKVKEIIKKSDVCIIPFILNDLIMNTNPVKIYEYFSMGKPVVASKIPELFEFKEYVYLYENDDEFMECITEALNEVEANNMDKYHKRLEIAQENTWEARVDRAYNLIQE